MPIQCREIPVSEKNPSRTPVLLSHGVAKSRGRRTYYTGKKCPQGHYSERYTSSRACIQCRIEYFESQHELGQYVGEVAAKAMVAGVLRGAPVKVSSQHFLSKDIESI